MNEMQVFWRYLLHAFVLKHAFIKLHNPSYDRHSSAVFYYCYMFRHICATLIEFTYEIWNFLKYDITTAIPTEDIHNLTSCGVSVVKESWELS